MDITLRQLEIFHAVVVAGSITKASSRIGLSQPSISQQLAKLEESLDTKLIERNRTSTVTLTPAGEFWLKHADEMLRRMEATVKEHEQRFRHSNVVLRFGVTPALRGRFVTAAADIALKEPDFVKFELVYDLNSAGLIDQLRMHKIHIAIVSESAIGSEASSFATSHLFTDQMALAVPSFITDDDLRQALRPDADPRKIHPVLDRYVEIDAAVPTRTASDDWYRNWLPHATAVFSAPTFVASTDIVASGLGTCHLPLSVLQNLPDEVRAKMRIHVIDGMSRKIAIVMRKHLLTHGTYARIFRGIVEYCQREFAPAIGQAQSQRVSQLLPENARLRLVGA